MEKEIAVEKALICLGLFICLAVVGCSKKSVSYESTKETSLKASAKVTNGIVADRAYAVNEAMYDYEAVSEEYEMAAGYQPEMPAEAVEFERKLIKTANVSIEIKNLSDCEQKINDWVKNLGGYITNSSSWEYGASFTVRIPSKDFDSAMNQVGDFGRVLNRNINSEDVSDNYYDLQSRLQTKYILRDKLSSYLSQAKDIKDLLEIERQLNQVIEEIESTESRFKRLSGQIDYSTIYLDLQFERGKDEGGIILPDIKNSWNSFVSNIISFFISGIYFGNFYFWNPSDAAQKMFNFESLKPLYERYKDKGFEIYAVGLDYDKVNWASSIRAQQNEWINVFDGRGAASPALNAYNISGTPGGILIFNGDIAGPCISGEQELKREIARLL